MRTRRKVAQVEPPAQAPPMSSNSDIRKEYAVHWFNNTVIGLEVIQGHAMDGSQAAWTALHEMSETAIRHAVRVTSPGLAAVPLPADWNKAANAREERDDAYGDVAICVDSCYDRMVKGDLIARDILLRTARYLVERCSRELCVGTQIACKRACRKALEP
jgi:hypothetical protein